MDVVNIDLENLLVVLFSSLFDDVVVCGVGAVLANLTVSILSLLLFLSSLYIASDSLPSLSSGRGGNVGSNRSIVMIARTKSISSYLFLDFLFVVSFKKTMYRISSCAAAAAAAAAAGGSGSGSGGAAAAGDDDDDDDDDDGHRT